MNTNFGLFPPIAGGARDKERKRQMIQARALEDIEAWIGRSGLS
jgi:folate-dependent tRNA-U54 methylase TrmFO/GidA